MPVTLELGPHRYRGYAFDDSATARFRQVIAGPGFDALENYCCYSRCTQLVVAVTAPSVGPRPIEVCIPAPASTAAPSPIAPSCPGAIEVYGYLRPLTRFEAGSCCYATPR